MPVLVPHFLSMDLNSAQQQVAAHLYGRILTLAGPGSGKTKTLTERTGRLIKKGFDPASILCLTFTNKARDEMRQRIASVHGTAADKVFIFNFHGLAGNLLRKFGETLGYTNRLTIIDTDDQLDLILQLARKRGLSPTKPEGRALCYLANEWRESLGTESDLHALADARKISHSETRIIPAYVKLIHARNQTDFSGLLSETVRLLRDHPQIRTRLQKKFQFIQVDEYQDTNRAQNEIVELLASAQDNVLAVGDGDQSIYEWRGASPDAIPTFIRNGEGKTGKTTVVKLGTNYRSTPQIIATADKLIRHCTHRIAVEFSTINPPGELPKCVKFDTPEAEADGVAISIDNTIKSGTAPRQIAVFFRTNDMSRLIEQSLAKRQIPYQVVGSGSYYDRMEVKDVLAMLRFVCNPKDGISFHRIANKPARGMSDALIGRLEAFAEQHHIDLLTALQDRNLEFLFREGEAPAEPSSRMDAALRACREVRHIFDVAESNVATVATQLLNRTRYDDWLKERYDGPDYEDRSRNVAELLNSIVEFSRHHPRAGIADYLESISLYTDKDDVKTENAVKLMSLHASKGLEFDVVYIIGVEHRILPHDKALSDRPERGLDEERRLCYVGFTRARKLLRVTWCGKRQDTYARTKTARFKASIPSQFLLEAALISRGEYENAMTEAGFVSAATTLPTKKKPGSKRTPARRT